METQEFIDNYFAELGDEAIGTAEDFLATVYYGLNRFMVVNAGMIEDYGGKINVAFCQACGRAFI